MKELSIEEKAKAYDKAIEELRGLLEGIHEEKCEIMEEDIIKIFPELKESVDERIRKEILNYLYDVHDDDEERASWIAWLEKQCGHAKFINGIQVWDKVTRNKDGVLVNLSQLNRVAKQGEQKPAEWSEEDEMILSDIIKDLVHPWNEYIPYRIEDEIKWLKNKLKTLKNRVQSQPKPEWSEEDEAARNNIIAKLAILKSRAVDGGAEKEICEMEINWLKSLKDRVQPKQMWSEEDDFHYTRLENFLEVKEHEAKSSQYQREVHKTLKWLKSLHPQSQWKPSEEQMETLEYYMHTLVCNEHKEILFGLYADLKKLKE